MVGYKRNYQKHCKKDDCSSSSISSSFFNTICDSGYEIEERVQFTVIQTAENICNLLSMIGDECINLDGYFIQALNENCSLLTFAVGDPDEQKSQTLGVVRCILKKLCICFLENEVLRVTKPTTGPGTLAKLYCTLSSDDVDINNVYPSSTGDAIYVEPACLNEAKCIL